MSIARKSFIGYKKSKLKKLDKSILSRERHKNRNNIVKLERLEKGTCYHQRMLSFNIRVQFISQRIQRIQNAD